IHHMRLAMFRAKAELPESGNVSDSTRNGLNFKTPGVRSFLSGGTRYSSPLGNSGMAISEPPGNRGPVSIFTPSNTDSNETFAISGFSPTAGNDVSRRRKALETNAKSPW